MRINLIYYSFMLIELHFEQWSREARCSRATRVAIAKQQNAGQFANNANCKANSRVKCRRCLHHAGCDCEATKCRSICK